MEHETILPHQHGNENHIQKTKEQLDKINDFQMAADIFKQLDDASRLRIFWLLCHMEECVINIAALMEMTTPAVSHHLKQLRESGLITSCRHGKEVYYKAADTKQSRLLHHTLEQMMAMICPRHLSVEEEDAHDASELPGYQPQQIAVIREIHDYLLENLDRHITIEALSKKFLMNTTTIKHVFRAVYGMPIAAHMKEHRMKKAATLLTETSDSISSIAGRVGYENQSKFSAAFKEYFQMTPTEYRN